VQGEFYHEFRRRQAFCAWGARLRFAWVCAPLTRGRQRLRYGITPAEAGFRKSRLRDVSP